MGYGSNDGNGIDCRIIENVSGICRDCNRGVALANSLQRLWIEIANRHDGRIGRVMKVAYDVRPPISVADYTDINRLTFTISIQGSPSMGSAF